MPSIARAAPALGALALLACGGPPPRPRAPAPSAALVIEAIATLGADGRRVGPLRLRAAADPEAQALRGDGCWADDLRGQPVDGGLALDLGREVNLPWVEEKGRHEAILAEGEAVESASGAAGPRDALWVDLSWREAGLRLGPWRRGGALRFSDAPRVGRYGIDALGALSFPGEPSAAGLELIVRVDGEERRCGLRAPAGVDLAAHTAHAAVYVEHSTEQRVDLPDGRSALLRGRLRAPLGLRLPTGLLAPKAATPAAPGPRSAPRQRPGTRTTAAI